MKKLLCLSLSLFLGSISFAQVEKKTHQSQIENVIKESFDQIWSKLDSKKIAKFYTKDFLLLENGDIWNNDSIANHLNQTKLLKPNPKRVNIIEIIEIKITSKTAWIVYKNTATFYVEDRIVRRAGWLESATAVLTAGGWKLDMLHSTRVKNALIPVDSTTLK